MDSLAWYFLRTVASMIEKIFIITQNPQVIVYTGGEIINTFCNINIDVRSA